LFGDSVIIYSIAKHDLLYSSGDLAQIFAQTEVDMRPSAALMRKHFKKHDADKGLPYKDEFFDVVIMARRTMYHMKRKDNVLNEMLRVVNVGGAIFTDFFNFHIEGLGSTEIVLNSLRQMGFIFLKANYAMLVKDTKDKQIPLRYAGYVMEQSTDGEDDITFEMYSLVRPAAPKSDECLSFLSKIKVVAIDWDNTVIDSHVFDLEPQARVLAEVLSGECPTPEDIKIARDMVVADFKKGGDILNTIQKVMDMALARRVIRDDEKDSFTVSAINQKRVDAIVEAFKNL